MRRKRRINKTTRRMILLAIVLSVGLGILVGAAKSTIASGPMVQAAQPQYPLTARLLLQQPAAKQVELTVHVRNVSTRPQQVRGEVRIVFSFADGHWQRNILAAWGIRLGIGKWIDHMVDFDFSPFPGGTRACFYTITRATSGGQTIALSKCLKLADGISAAPL